MLIGTKSAPTTVNRWLSMLKIKVVSKDVLMILRRYFLAGNRGTKLRVYGVGINLGSTISVPLQPLTFPMPPSKMLGFESVKLFEETAWKALMCTAMEVSTGIC